MEDMDCRGTHWINQTGIDFEKNLDDYLGFIYCITQKSTGRRYIGRKQIWYKRGKNYYEGDWRTYRSSSNVVRRIISESGDHDWTYEIIGVFKTKSTMRYGETGSIVLSGSYEKPDRGFNGRIDACKGKIKWEDGDWQQWQRIRQYFRATGA